MKRLKKVLAKANFCQMTNDQQQQLISKLLIHEIDLSESDFYQLFCLRKGSLSFLKKKFRHSGTKDLALLKYLKDNKIPFEDYFVLPNSTQVIEAVILIDFLLYVAETRQLLIIDDLVLAFSNLNDDEYLDVFELFVDQYPKIFLFRDDYIPKVIPSKMQMLEFVRFELNDKALMEMLEFEIDKIDDSFENIRDFCINHLNSTQTKKFVRMLIDSESLSPRILKKLSRQFLSL